MADLRHDFDWKVEGNARKKLKIVKAICLEKQVLAQKDATGFTFGKDRQMLTTEVDAGAKKAQKGVMEQA